MLCFVVGGLRSPWRGEYKEPRHPPPLAAHAPPSPGPSHRTPHAQPRELSPGDRGPQPTEDTTGGAPQLQPPLPPEPPERNKSPSLTWGKEESGTWEPLPLSSLDPAPTKHPSSAERKAPLPEQELQQLEIGTGGPGGAPGSRGPPRPVRPPPEVCCFGPCGQTHGRAGRSRSSQPSSASLRRTVPEQPVPALLAGGTGADSFVPQRRQPLSLGRQ